MGGKYSPMIIFHKIFSASVSASAKKIFRRGKEIFTTLSYNKKLYYFFSLGQRQATNFALDLMAPDKERFLRHVMSSLTRSWLVMEVLNFPPSFSNNLSSIVSHEFNRIPY